MKVEKTHRLYVFVQNNDAENQKETDIWVENESKKNGETYNIQKLEVRSNIKSNPLNGIRGSKELEHKAYMSMPSGNISLM